MLIPDPKAFGRIVVADDHILRAFSALGCFLANDPARWAGLLHFAPSALRGMFDESSVLMAFQCLGKSLFILFQGVPRCHRAVVPESASTAHQRP
jgi:hypothetical protein